MKRLIEYIKRLLGIGDEFEVLDDTDDERSCKGAMMHYIIPGEKLNRD